MSCGHVTAMRRNLIGGACLRGCGNVAGALCPKLPCDRCESCAADKAIKEGRQWAESIYKEGDRTIVTFLKRMASSGD